MFSGLRGKALLAYKGIILITCWQIWKARNELVFSGKKPKAEEVFSAIKSIGFLWFKIRLKYNDLSWVKWCKFV
ncbi:hypothetical protein HanIR_Chr10g0492371 [Helianthus annuus]|nr:hypothetical protein HanIR_Chr10g0492371 [Helianthus annuus]